MTGIYVVDAELPAQGASGPYGLTVGQPGMIHPSFWMWGVNPLEIGDTLYNELDGFEFTLSQYDWGTNIHVSELHVTNSTYQCGVNVDPDNTPFGNGSDHVYTSIYSPQELDWYVDNTLARSDTRDYFTLTTGMMYPLNCTDNETSSILSYQQNMVYPDVPMWLTVGDGVQYNTPNPACFPTYFYVKSIKYYIESSYFCNQPNTLTATSNYFSNSGGNNFNWIEGTTITLDGTTNGAINIPFQRPHNQNCLGNLEAIAQNSIVITGTFTNSGYLVLKTDPNVCDEYSGPLPIDLNYAGPVKGSGNDTGIHNKNVIKQDTLALQVKNSVTKGQISVCLTNISSVELNQTATVMVYNMLGQVLFDGVIKVLEDNSLLINLSSYANGVYLVMVKTNSIVLHKKIVLEK
jgi:hypothetical protein